jgi:hypothetical protein
MIPHIPAEGILKRNDWGNTKTYQVACECTDSDHDHFVWVEADEHVNVTIYTRQRSKWWELSRWQQIWTLLTRGFIEGEVAIVMTEQQALNYSATLKQAIDDVHRFQQENKQQS